MYETNQEQYHVITYVVDDDHRRVHKRMAFMKEITQKAKGSTTEIKLSGPSFLTKIYSGIIIGDLTAYYLGLRLGKDPSKVEAISQFKKKMGPYISQ